MVDDGPYDAFINQILMEFVSCWIGIKGGVCEPQGVMFGERVYQQIRIWNKQITSIENRGFSWVDCHLVLQLISYAMIHCIPAGPIVTIIT